MIADMIASAKRTIVLADRSKFDHDAFAHIVPLAKIHVLVTDQEPVRDLTQALAKAGIDVVVALS